MASYISFLAIILFAGTCTCWVDIRHEILDSDGAYLVDWEINHSSKIVTFNVTARTTGFVGFGISVKGKMEGSDIVIGGVNPDGSVYFSDRHGEGNFEPVLDSEPSWALIQASENASHTMLQFFRAFETCKDGDLPFTNDTTNFIWAMGESDVLRYHGMEGRGVFTTNMLDPAVAEVDLGALQSYDVSHRMVMPKKHTSYHCTIHRSPVFQRKNHIVAFETKLETAEAIKHAHHYGIYKCFPPEGVDAETFFEPFVGQVGGECYDSDQSIVPSEHCRSLFYVWAVGGRTLPLPEDVGYPIGGDGVNSREYYMYEIHYDNPDELDNVEFETTTRIYYTEQLRKHEAGIWVVGKFLENMVSITIPPKSVDLVLASHCSPHCLQEGFPSDGIQVINVLLHAHLAGRKIKMRHFRNNKELPWGANDESYDFNYQQSRPLREFLHVLPGDHMTVECTYDSTFREGTTVGGQSTREEMCESIMWYYPKIDLLSCYSEYTIENWFQKFGIEDAEWNNNYNLEPIITAPERYRNMTYTQVLDNLIDWTPELREEIQWDVRYAAHKATCAYENGSKVEHTVTYPHVKEAYHVNLTCTEREIGDNSFGTRPSIMPSLLCLAIGILWLFQK